jgi:hypothetical protein
MLIDLNMNPSRQDRFILAQDRSFLKPRQSEKSGTSQIISFEHAKASAALAASCKRAIREPLCESIAKLLDNVSALSDARTGQNAWGMSIVARVR